MTKTRIAKIAGIAAGASLVLGTFVPMAGAQTVAELQAQINALMAQLATMQSGSVATGTAMPAQFTTDLTVGSTGASVTALQQLLVSKGFLTMPANVAYGYFGSLTQSAVAAWQTASGISPAAGYFGPKSRAVVNAMTPGSVTGTTTTTTGCPVGAMYSSVTGALCSAGGVITTPGVEGTVTASKDATPASGTKAYEGGAKVGVLGIKLEAKISDIKIERVKLQLSAVTSGNSDQQFYTKIASKIYVMDGSTVLASMPLDSTTVVKEGSTYYITVAGFSFIVPKDATKVLTIAIDPQASWDSTYDNDSWKLTVPVDGVRGVDGAGVNEYSPTTAFNNEFTSAADVVDSASLVVSLATDSPVTGQVIANEGSSDNELDGLVLAIINFKGEKDQVKVTDLVADITRGGNNVATATTAYVYDGSTLVGSASVAGTTATAMTATFSDIDWIIPADTTKTLTLKVDIDSAALAADTFIGGIGNVTAVATAITSENSDGSSIIETGSAAGKTMTVRKVGPEVTQVSKSITTSGVAQSDTATNLSTSTLSATFNIKIKAVGGTLTFGTVASGTPLFASSTASFKVYRNGAYDSTLSSGATSTSYSIPSTCVTGGTNSCTLTDGNEVTVPVTFQISGRTVAGLSLTRGSLYSIGFEGIQWFNATSGAVQTTTFMAGETDWRTADVSFP
jgi:hypothetical protein